MKVPLILLSVTLVFVSSCNKEQPGQQDQPEQPSTFTSITGEATDITYSSATISGQAKTNGDTSADAKFGILYSKSESISYGSATEAVAKTYDSNFNYSIKINGLDAQTTYYFCSYLFIKEKIYYGEVKSFITPEIPLNPDLSANGTANCYIVHKAGDYKFKATVKGNSTTSVGSISSVAVLWETFGTSDTPAKGSVINNSVSLKDGYIHFSTPATLKNGNAVIVAKNASGTILWSWHIWVCKDYAPTKSNQQVYDKNAGIMMDRNLGATSSAKGDAGAIGLLYQWGRKDPFLNSANISAKFVAASTLSWPSAVPSNSSTGTIAYTVSHPTTFIITSNSDYDWRYSSDDTRWKSTKTMYDPCPPHWRVPDGGVNGVWSTAFCKSSGWTTASNWDSVNKGMDFGQTDRTLGTGTIWYPASGVCEYNNGSLYGIGGRGNYWSCTTINSKAYCLFFDYDGWIQPSSSIGRAYGMAVRCVSEQ